MLRVTFIAVMVIVSNHLKAQTFRAKVLDLVTKEAISGAAVKGNSITLTDENGNFKLPNAKIGDTIMISHMAYKPYFFTFNADHPGLGYGLPPEIALEPINILLTEVYVRSTHNTKADSIKNRLTFASEFNHKRIGFKDIFVAKSPEELMASHVDVHRGNNSYSASSLIKVDLLSAVSLLSRNKTHPSRLKEKLIQDERDKFVEKVFSQDRIIELTKLTGDSLKTFMIRYRPTLANARKLTDYEMIGYIMKMYLEFSK